MGYQTISFVATDAGADGPALSAALAVADRQDAHLDIHCVGVDPARYEPLPAGSAAIVMETGAAEARARAEELQDWIKGGLPANMSKLAIEPVVIPHLGLDTLVGRLTRYSDLVVATRPYSDKANPLHVSVLEAELFGTGAPVLVVPEKGAAKPFNRIVVAWNESSESFNAVRAALPFLKAAEKVDIVMIDPPSHSPERSDPGGAICLMLARHGVKAEVSILARTLPRVSEVLERFAEEHGADLIVMGAYGHSRFRESILGGATRDLLGNATLPLLMAH
ncbi:universal stress protein [Loktanella sp. IMCC34160]|uniref:universal stress protein n=1 Tax=Loktanella sp. IMCC34160 TaxID=2510646 RepID=UPI00101C3EC6|nr:universal stress protein [Loktanella sp. IMCC34160]RYG92690.1 universal stress protein [Loktanella sp. IMCC34160]